ncbi:MAG: transcription termination/antitermination factor NusG [Lentisphaerae bacterium]|nr:transcription termination/antitermination factor NusG [Lentisphaerota bacterium]
MTKQWFVLHTLTGQEQKVKRFIEAQARMQELDGFIGDVVIPTEKVADSKTKTTVVRKFFPGYALINLALYDDERKLIAATWRFIRDTPGVIGFLGGEKPVPLSQAEVDAIFDQVEAKRDKIRPKVVFEPGEPVTILEGAFKGSQGAITEVDPDRGRLKVNVMIFGKEVPVELEYWQVEKAVDRPAQPGEVHG